MIGGHGKETTRAFRIGDISRAQSRGRSAADLFRRRRPGRVRPIATGHQREVWHHGVRLLSDDQPLSPDAQRPAPPALRCDADVRVQLRTPHERPDRPRRPDVPGPLPINSDHYGVLLRLVVALHPSQPARHSHRATSRRLPLVELSNVPRLPAGTLVPRLHSGTQAVRRQRRAPHRLHRVRPGGTITTRTGRRLGRLCQPRDRDGGDVGRRIHSAQIRSNAVGPSRRERPDRAAAATHACGRSCDPAGTATTRCRSIDPSDVRHHPDLPRPCVL